MVSPGELRLLAELAEGTIDAVEPAVDTDAGECVYPDAETLLDDDDGAAADVLEELARRGLLDRSFREKVYACPDCGSDELQYDTACPSCGSFHVVETAVVRHWSCGHVAPESSYERGDGSYVCPGCEEPVRGSDDHEDVLRDVETVPGDVCRDCQTHVETPDPRLRCPRDCPPLTPEAAVAHVLYRYTITDEGEAWLDAQRDAREAVVEALRDRGFETTVSTTVTDGGAAVPVHVHAEDPLLDSRVVAAVHDQPDVDEAETLRRAADVADAQAILLSVSGKVSERVADVARTSGVNLRTVDGDGELHGDVTIDDDAVRPPTLLERLTAAVTH